MDNTEPEVKFGWFGLELDDSGDEIPDKYVGSLGTYSEDGMESEVAVIVHRASDRFPVDGDVYNAKNETGEDLRDLLNLALAWSDGDAYRYPQEALADLITIAKIAKSIRDRA